MEWWVVQVPKWERLCLNVIRSARADDVACLRHIPLHCGWETLAEQRHLCVCSELKSKSYVWWLFKSLSPPLGLGDNNEFLLKWDERRRSNWSPGAGILFMARCGLLGAVTAAWSWIWAHAVSFTLQSGKQTPVCFILVHFLHLMPCGVSCLLWLRAYYWHNNCVGAFGDVNVIIFYNRSRMLISPLSAHLLIYTPVWSQALYIFLSIHNVFSSPSVWSLIRLSGTATEISTMKRFLFSTKKPNISNVIYVTRSCTQDLD